MCIFYPFYFNFKLFAVAAPDACRQFAVILRICSSGFIRFGCSFVLLIRPHQIGSFKFFYNLSWSKHLCLTPNRTDEDCIATCYWFQAVARLSPPPPTDCLSFVCMYYSSNRLFCLSVFLILFFDCVALTECLALTLFSRQDEKWRSYEVGRHRRPTMQKNKK